MAPAGPQQEETTVNIDVILPQPEWMSWQHVINDALNVINKAQESCSKRVKLNLRYHDEDRDDIKALAYALTHPGKGDSLYVQTDTCHAIIGPYHSYNARIILDQAQRLRLPVVMPTCTSSDLQRIESQQTNTFFFTESDITQCQVLLSVMQAVGHERVCLLYSNDTYGQSFRDWFGFIATQIGLEVVSNGIRTYEKGQDLQDYFDLVGNNPGEKPAGLLIALSNVQDYVSVMDNLQQSNASIVPYVADTGLSSMLLSYKLYGTYPVGSSENGFMQNYFVRHGENVPYGAAQMYDALTTIALGRFAQFCSPDPNQLIIDGEPVAYEIAPFGPVLSDWMRAVLAQDNPAPATLWIGYGLASAFRYIENGTFPSLHGASGELKFDQQTHTTILHTNYMLWESDGTGNIIPFATVSTSGNAGLSTKSIWKWEASIQQLISGAGADRDNDYLPDLKERWALVISPSTTWNNYRHQSDALAMYQLLKYSGYDDDHIVLIVEDNLANDPQNPFPGQIFLERSKAGGDLLTNTNIRQDIMVDYHFSDLNSPSDLADILLGRSSERLPHVINSTESDNVFIFWSGHGADNGGPLWGNEDSHMTFGAQRIRNILEQMVQPRCYRRMMLVLETCYSGKWGETLTGLPSVLVLSAANAVETSKADIYDPEIRTFLSNAFSRSFLRTVGANPNISIADLYYQLARTTSGSHVTLYNIEQYGSANNNTIGDYFMTHQ